MRAIPSRTDPSVIASFARRTCNPGVCTGANFPTLDSLVEFDARVAENTPDMRRRFYEHHRPRPVPDVYCAFAKRDLSDPKE